MNRWQVIARGCSWVCDWCIPCEEVSLYCVYVTHLLWVPWRQVCAPSLPRWRCIVMADREVHSRAGVWVMFPDVEHCISVSSHAGSISLSTQGSQREGTLPASSPSLPAMLFFLCFFVCFSFLHQFWPGEPPFDSWLLLLPFRPLNQPFVS